MGRLPADVSVDIRSLERQLDEKLFEAKSRGMWPTPAAHRLAEQVAPHLDALLGATRTTDVNMSPLSGELRIGGPAELVSARVAPALLPLVKRGLQLKLMVGNSVEMLARLSAGEIDIAVSAVRPMSKGIDHAELFHERFLLVGAPRFAEGVVAGMTPEKMAKSLREMPLIATGPDMPLLRPWWQAVFGSTLYQRPAVIVGDLRAAIDIAVAGAGIVVAPHYAIEAAMERGDLVNLVPALEPPTNTIEMVWRRSPTLPKAVGEARRMLEDLARTW